MVKAQLLHLYRAGTSQETLASTFRIPMQRVHSVLRAFHTDEMIANAQAVAISRIRQEGINIPMTPHEVVDALGLSFRDRGPIVRDYQSRLRLTLTFREFLDDVAADHPLRDYLHSRFPLLLFRGIALRKFRRIVEALSSLDLGFEGNQERDRKLAMVEGEFHYL